MDQIRAVPWNLKIPAMSIALVVQLLLISSSSYAQSSVPFSDGGVGLRTDLTTADSVTQPPVSFTSISTVIVTVLSTLTPPPSQEPPSSTNTTASATSSSVATLPQTDTANLTEHKTIPTLRKVLTPIFQRRGP
ncbi:uncharacterized protein LOC105445435 [Strongylocentrotus purpuratus]|uniref:Uncharacterized protein n=1 Tax=Strongylocentrotus purpuratus TaxID=7668 RepID=A0A7M7HPJ2_STRPU|nr:uncharacterized protein LOC105445435 [Strongylocentrotus purpuratus]